MKGTFSVKYNLKIGMFNSNKSKVKALNSHKQQATSVGGYIFITCAWRCPTRTKFSAFSFTVLSSGLPTLRSGRTSYVCRNFTPVLLDTTEGLRHSLTVLSSGLPILGSGRTSYALYNVTSVLSDTTEVCGILLLFYPLFCRHFVQGGPAMYVIISQLYCWTHKRFAAFFHCFILWFADPSFREDQLCIV